MTHKTIDEAAVDAIAREVNEALDALDSLSVLCVFSMEQAGHRNRARNALNTIKTLLREARDKARQEKEATTCCREDAPKAPKWPDDYDAETVAMSGGTGVQAAEFVSRGAAIERDGLEMELRYVDRNSYVPCTPIDPPVLQQFIAGRWVDVPTVAASRESNTKGA